MSESDEKKPRRGIRAGLAAAREAREAQNARTRYADRCAWCDHKLEAFDEAWRILDSDPGRVAAANYCGDRLGEDGDGVVSVACLHTDEVMVPCARRCRTVVEADPHKVEIVAIALRRRLAGGP